MHASISASGRAVGRHLGLSHGRGTSSRISGTTANMSESRTSPPQLVAGVARRVGLGMTLWKLVRRPTNSRVYIASHATTGEQESLSLGRFLGCEARALRKNAIRSLRRRLRSSGVRGAPPGIKPKPVLYGSGTETAGLGGGGLDAFCLCLAENGMPAFTGVVLLDSGRRMIAEKFKTMLEQTDDEQGLP